jgi:hypothetical protein
MEPPFAVIKKEKTSPVKTLESQLKALKEHKSPKEDGQESIRTSESGGGTLKTMLRVEIDFPSTKVVNLIDEYNEFLEDNGFIDEREAKSQKNVEPEPVDKEAVDEE